MTSELEEIFSNAPAAPNGLTSERMQLINAAVTGNTTASSEEEMAPRRRPLKRGDPCPICYEDLSSDLTNALVFCETGCGEALHRECRLKVRLALGLFAFSPPVHFNRTSSETPFCVARY